MMRFVVDGVVDDDVSLVKGNVVVEVSYCRAFRSCK
jgi:hypothetical protein